MRKYIAAAALTAATVTAAPALAGGQYYGGYSSSNQTQVNGTYRDRDGYLRDRNGNIVNDQYAQAYNNGRFTVDANGNLRDRQGRIVNDNRAQRNGYIRDRDGYWRDRSGNILYAEQASTQDLYRDRNGVLRDRRTGQVVDERYAANYDGPTWTGQDGRTYCRRGDGTTGLLIGGAGGAVLGRVIDGGRNKALGTILGGVAGAVAGRAIDRGRSCQ